MEHHYISVPAHDIITKDRFGKFHTTHFPEHRVLIAPTLSQVHDWLWDYPFNYSWRDGLLCPFASSGDRQNTTCSHGLRTRCLGTLITEHLINVELPYERKQIGKVSCYRWSHRLIDAYWNIPITDLLSLPDDAYLCATIILRRVYRDSGWFEWHRELVRRKNGQRTMRLRPLSPQI